MSEFVWTFLGGKLKQEVTEIVLANNTEKIEDITVPTGKRWLLLNIKLVNPDDVQRSISVVLYKEVAKTNVILHMLSAFAMATGVQTNIPSYQPVSATVTNPLLHGFMVIEAANTISITWAAGGASAGGTDADGLVITYLEIDAP